MKDRSDLIAALEQIEREKGIKKEEILTMIEGALINSLRKHVGKNAVIEASIDPKTAEFKAFVVKTVVEKVADPELEIGLQDARRAQAGVLPGDSLRLPAPATDFARIAAQAAKQVLTQKIREVERDSLYGEFKPKEGTLVTGSVYRFVDRTIIVELGRAEGLLPVREQIRREHYAIGQTIRALVLRVERAPHAPRLILSRADPAFLKKLLELEVPEIQDGIVQIKEVARDPGHRAKVLVSSDDPKIDPVGACIGVRGTRIRSLSNDLAGERIDLIPFSPKPETLIANALSPAKVRSVRVLDPRAKKAAAFVAEDQVAIALGREGQNVTLASRLTGWTLEIRPLAPGAKKETGPSAEAGGELKDFLMGVEGVGAKTVEALIAQGVSSVAQIAAMSPEDLAGLKKGISAKTAAAIITSAQKRVETSAVRDPRAGGPENPEGANASTRET